MFDLRKRGKVNRIGLAGVNGTKFPGIRAHMKKAISEAYVGLDISVDTYPADNDVNQTPYAGHRPC